MNRYILLDLLDNVIYDTTKVKIDFKENEEQTSSTTCNDRIDLCNEGIKWLLEIKQNELKEQLKYLEDRLNVCAYEKRELQEIEYLNFNIDKINSILEELENE